MSHLCPTTQTSGYGNLFNCTLDRGHDGDHEAHAGGLGAVRAWPQIVTGMRVAITYTTTGRRFEGTVTEVGNSFTGVACDDGRHRYTTSLTKIEALPDAEPVRPRRLAFDVTRAVEAAVAPLYDALSAERERHHAAAKAADSLVEENAYVMARCSASIARCEVLNARCDLNDAIRKAAADLATLRTR